MPSPSSKTQFQADTGKPKMQGSSEKLASKRALMRRYGVESLMRFTSAPVYSIFTQISFLTYYALLAVYAITNLVLLMLQSGLSLYRSSMIAAAFTMCAITNEWIDMLVTINPLSKSNRKAWFPENTWHRRVPLALVVGGVTIAAAVGDLFNRTINMVFLQCADLSRKGIVLPRAMKQAYISIFGVSAVFYLLTTALTTVLKFLTTRVFPVAVAKNESTVAPKPNRSFMSPLLDSYLANPWLTFTGSSIGASLYAIGDAMQMSMLFVVLADRGILALPALMTTTLVGIMFVSTLIERSSIWGYNFAYYAQSQVDTSKTPDLPKRIYNNPVIAMMQQSSFVRSIFTFSRIIAVCVINVAGLCLHFTGRMRLLGLFSSLGYCAQQAVQLSFQTTHDIACRKKMDVLRSTSLYRLFVKPRKSRSSSDSAPCCSQTVSSKPLVCAQ